MGVPARPQVWALVGMSEAAHHKLFFTT